LTKLLKATGVIAAIGLILAASSACWAIWWYAPVSVEAKTIEKVIDSDVAQDQVPFCNAFKMTPEAFRAYWKDVRPIFDVEFHDYSFGSCYFKATEGGKSYSVGIGGVGMVTKGDTTYYYVRKNDNPDFADQQ
jgi:hypothetical protein